MNKLFKLTLIGSLIAICGTLLASEGTTDVALGPANLTMVSSDISSDGGCGRDPYCRAFVPVTLSVTTYGATVTVGLVLLLKKDDVRSLLEHAEMEGEVSAVLKSVVEQMQSEFKNKSGFDISEEEALSQLQDQTI
jgi:hypothetical protein